MKQVNIQVPRRILGLILGLFLSVGAFAQIEVKGHVKDAAGEDIIGATVRVEGTQTATVSDFESGGHRLRCRKKERPDWISDSPEARFKEQGSGGKCSGHAGW